MGSLISISGQNAYSMAATWEKSIARKEYWKGAHRGRFCKKAKIKANPNPSSQLTNNTPKRAKVNLPPSVARNRILADLMHKASGCKGLWKYY